jgi:transposase
MQVSTIGLDLAKNVFQVHGVDAAGKTVITRQLRRGQVIEFFGKLPPCLVGMEACASAHHWARELAKLGHTVRLMPASIVQNINNYGNLLNATVPPSMMSGRIYRKVVRTLAVFDIETIYDKSTLEAPTEAQGRRSWSPPLIVVKSKASMRLK